MKPLLWKLARHAGVLTAWRHRHRYSVAMLTVHGVMDDGDGTSWQPLWHRLHVEHFERVLRILRPHYEFVTVSEAVKMLSGEQPMRPNCMALTFDDGYKNNFTHALPVLERLCIPATFFICSGMIGARRGFWIDRLDYVIQRLPQRTRIIRVADKRIALNFSSRTALARSYLELRLLLKSAYRDDFDMRVDELAAELEQEAGAALIDVIDTDTWAGIMSWDDAREARRRGFEIGSHTVDHVRLNIADAAKIWNQLTLSRADIERETEHACLSLAYPNGDYSIDAIELARRAGYRCAVTTENGLNRSADELFTLRRLNFPRRRHPDHILALASGFQAAVSQWRVRTV